MSASCCSSGTELPVPVFSSEQFPSEQCSARGTALLTWNFVPPWQTFLYRWCLLVVLPTLEGTVVQHSLSAGCHWPAAPQDAIWVSKWQWLCHTKANCLLISFSGFRAFSHTEKPQCLVCFRIQSEKVCSLRWAAWTQTVPQTKTDRTGDFQHLACQNESQLSWDCFKSILHEG